MRDQLLGSIDRIRWKDLFPYLGLTIVILFFQTITGSVFAESNMKALLGEGFYIMIGAVGYIFVIAQGNLDFSISGIMAISCAVSAVAAQMNPWLAAPTAIITGMAAGMVNGFAVSVLKLDSFITTLAFGFVLNGGVVIVLRGGIIAAQPNMLSWSTNTLKLFTILAVVGMGFLLFNYTAYGKQCRAIGSSREAAYQTGVRVRLIMFTAFVIMGGLSGLLGFFSLIRTGTASSSTGATFLTNAWNAVLLGGIPIEGGATTKFRGVIIGSLTMAVLANGMTIMGLDANVKQLVTGIIFILVIAISFNRKNLTVIK